jgi:hypothetical protein
LSYDAFYRLPNEVVCFARTVGARHGVDLADVLAIGDSRREPRVMRARHEFRAITIWTLGLTTTEASRMLGLDRSTLAHSQRVYEAKLS